jgi:hypothetical protein
MCTESATPRLLLPFGSHRRGFCLAIPSVPTPSLQDFGFTSRGFAPTSFAHSLVIWPITRSSAAFPRPTEIVKLLAAEWTSCVSATNPIIYTRLVKNMFAWQLPQGKARLQLLQAYNTNIWRWIPAFLFVSQYQLFIVKDLSLGCSRTRK